MSSNRISVIVTAHDRKQYILEALNSVLNQSLSKLEVELVVVKNYRDSKIDSRLAEIHAKNVFTNSQSTGEKIALGIENSTGNIISFLDDDDEFLEDKLQTVADSFASNPSLGLYHNGNIRVKTGDEKISNLTNVTEGVSISVTGNDLISKFKDLYVSRTSYNLSSFSISRKLALSVTERIRKLKTNVDTVLLFLAVDEGYDILSNTNPLTRILVHNSLSRNLSGDGSFRESKVKFMNKSTRTLEKLKSCLEKEELKDFVDCQIWELKMLINLMGTHSYRGLLRLGLIVKSTKLFPGFYILKILAATFASYFAPNKISELYRDYSIQNRTW